MGFEESSAQSFKAAGFVSQVQLGSASEVRPYAGSMTAGFLDFKLTPVDLKIVIGPGAFVPLGGPLVGLMSGVDLKMLGCHGIDKVKKKTALYGSHKVKSKSFKVKTKQSILKESYGVYKLKVSAANPQPEEIAVERATAVTTTSALLAMGMGALGLADLDESIDHGVGGSGGSGLAAAILGATVLGPSIAGLLAFTQKTASSHSLPTISPFQPGLYSLNCDELHQSVEGKYSVSSKVKLTEKAETLEYRTSPSRLTINNERVSMKGTTVELTNQMASLTLKKALVKGRGSEGSFSAETVDFDE